MSNRRQDMNSDPAVLEHEPKTIFGNEIRLTKSREIVILHQGYRQNMSQVRKN